MVALTGCARASLGICASSSGGIAGLVQWQVRAANEVAGFVMCSLEFTHLRTVMGSLKTAQQVQLERG